jgi:hypothetical protein
MSAPCRSKNGYPAESIGELIPKYLVFVHKYGKKRQMCQELATVMS